MSKDLSSASRAANDDYRDHTRLQNVVHESQGAEGPRLSSVHVPGALESTRPSPRVTHSGSLSHPADTPHSTQSRGRSFSGAPSPTGLDGHGANGDDNPKPSRLAKLGQTARSGAVLLGLQPAHRGASTRFDAIDPRSTVMRRWDGVVAILLIFIMVVSPFEVGFLRVDPDWYTPLFWINRSVDLGFFIDLCLNFNLMYYDPEAGRWISKHSAIVRRAKCRGVKSSQAPLAATATAAAPLIGQRLPHYILSGYCLIDLISCIPFDLISTIHEHHHPEDEDVLAVLRVLRLLKLLRMLRFGRVLRRIEDHHDVNYSYLKLFKFMMGTFLLAHWMACMFHLVREESLDECDWVTQYYNRQTGADVCAYNGPSMLSRYISSVYWAATTISTVGYGDIVPATDTERGYVIVGLFVGASFFSYIVGSVCSVIAKLMERDTIFEGQMTNLNAFIRAAKLTGDLPTRLRAYFRYQNTTTRMADWTDILDKLTPALRGAVAIQMHSSWIADVDVFSMCPKTMLIRLSFAFESQTFPPSEEIIRLQDPLRMCIIQRGVVAVFPLDKGAKGFKVKTQGQCFGEELLWSARPSVFTAGALTYTDVQSIDRETLFPIIDSFPGYKRTRLEKLIRVRILRDKMRLFVAAVHRMERQYAGKSVTSGGLAFTEIAISAIPPIVMWEMQNRGNEEETSTPYRTDLDGSTVGANGGCTHGNGDADDDADGDAEARRQEGVGSRAERDENLIRQLQSATSSSFAGEEEEEDAGDGRGGSPSAPLFTMESVLLCMAKAVPDYFELASGAAVCIQRVFRGYNSRLDMMQWIEKARRMQLPLKEVIRRDGREREPEDSQTLAVLVAREVLSMMKLQGLVVPHQQHQQQRAGGAGAGSGAAGESESPSSSSGRRGGGVGRRTLATTSDGLGWPFHPGIPSLVERSVFANGNLRERARLRSGAAARDAPATASASASRVEIDIDTAAEPARLEDGIGELQRGHSNVAAGPAGLRMPPRPTLRPWASAGASGSTWVSGRGAAGASTSSLVPSAEDSGQDFSNAGRRSVYIGAPSFGTNAAQRPQSNTAAAALRASFENARMVSFAKRVGDGGAGVTASGGGVRAGNAGWRQLSSTSSAVLAVARPGRGAGGVATGQYGAVRPHTKKPPRRGGAAAAARQDDEDGGQAVDQW